jgi:hypothetical protein
VAKVGKGNEADVPPSLPPPAICFGTHALFKAKNVFAAVIPLIAWSFGKSKTRGRCGASKEGRGLILRVHPSPLQPLESATAFDDGRRPTTAQTTSVRTPPLASSSLAASGDAELTFSVSTLQGNFPDGCRGRFKALIAFSWVCFILLLVLFLCLPVLSFARR